jgi:hypothetical protein
MLNNPKVRHEVGQSEQTEALTKMQSLEEKYLDLREKVHKEGAQYCNINISICLKLTQLALSHRF